MPFRERVRRALTRTSSGNSASSSLEKSPSKESDIYQPGEKMPPLKYRRPVTKEHKELLERFSFATAWRRRSIDSIYSPMGSRMPSRRNSFASTRTSLTSCESIQINRLTASATTQIEQTSSLAHDAVAKVPDDCNFPAKPVHQNTVVHD